MVRTRPPGPAHHSAGDDALLSIEAKTEPVRLLVADLDHAVVLFGLEEVSELQSPAAAHARDVVTLGRVHANDLHARVLRLEESSRPGDGAAGAERRDEVGDLAARLLPDLRTSRAKVRIGIGRILVLIELFPTRSRGQLGGLGHGPFGLAGHGHSVSSSS